jgi:OOP family OmpA-OmpF porin
MHRKVLLTVAAVAICGLCLPAWGGEGYLGASYLNTSAEFQTSLETYDTSSSGWKIFGGYNMMKYFGVEVTYYDLGSFDASTDIESIDAGIKVFDLCGRGILPLGKRFELFARLGYSSVDVDFQKTTGFVTTDASARDWELLYGAGATLKIGKTIGIRAEYEAWDVETSLDTWSLGLVFGFGGR